ncbi:hypothetical protein EJ02DRAFT_501855 [Clathrospora elynae]|uniref:DUF8021 domain-containing protein n=1 Tax=Clathrospora elynae TaxID=706981 RepID=A0A6A5SVI7_9PLEO|nr:hypothetical protein EJ02DRAFT_501855 [Clathrospora elynae]
MHLYTRVQIAGKPSSLKLAVSNFTHQQNNKVSDIAKGLLSTPFKMNLNRSTADTVACASYTMWISTTDSKPYVVSTQLRHVNNDTSTISTIDTVSATTSDLFFDAAKILTYIRNETWTSLPASSRPSRALLKRVGDAYLDIIPWGTDCERVEGSAYKNLCGKSLPSGGSKKNNDMRRYVIDEETGRVEIPCQFDSLGAWPDSHEVRVVDGKVKYKHTVTVMRGVSA